MLPPSGQFPVPPWDTQTSSLWSCPRVPSSLCVQGPLWPDVEEDPTFSQIPAPEARLGSSAPCAGPLIIWGLCSALSQARN